MHRARLSVGMRCPGTRATLPGTTTRSRPAPVRRRTPWPQGTRRIKSVEDSIRDTDEPEHRLTQAPLRPRPDRLRRRRDHRHRHLRADRRGRQDHGGARGGHLLRDRRRRLRAGRPLLRRVRLHRAGGGLGLHVLLRHPRRVRRLDHRLGPRPGARARRRDGRRSAGRATSTSCSATSGIPLPDVDRRGDGDGQHPGDLHRAADDRRADPRHQAVVAGHLGDRGDQGRDRAAGDRGRASSTCKAANYTPFVPPAEPTETGSGLDRPADPDAVRLRARAPSAWAASSPGRRSSSSPSSASTSSPPPPRRRRTRSGTCPRGIIGSLAICTVLYVAVSLVVVGMQNYTELSSDGPAGRRLPQRRAAVLLRRSSRSGALAGLTSRRDDPDARPVAGAVRHEPRPPAAAGARRGAPAVRHAVQDHPHHRRRRRRRSPGSCRSSTLAELVNIGTLFAFVLVSIGVIILRRTRPDLPRAFRVPLGAVLPIVSVLACFYLMLNLPGETWLRFVRLDGARRRPLLRLRPAAQPVHHPRRPRGRRGRERRAEGRDAALTPAGEIRRRALQAAPGRAELTRMAISVLEHLRGPARSACAAAAAADADRDAAACRWPSSPPALVGILEAVGLLAVALTGLDGVLTSVAPGRLAGRRRPRRCSPAGSCCAPAAVPR